ncbi:hypothetical protein KIN20_006803 [Parelaphostrongylus tenuis]|uniref:Uncharacterized protein n=1 Tax=Parelaphostrongylus tenuis TaxID=148309 RepID=A0AAD5QLB7_PARTN|nr:hypothetical protein KIN20_006803 [Parelaphostrongylus tenuis]
MSTTSSCGVMPAGQTSSRPFTVTGFTTLPVQMVFTEMAAAQVPGISTTRGAAQAFISRLAVRTVFDVLERQGRSALLPDPIISAILDQFNVTITYEPRLCKTILNGPTDAMTDIPMMDSGCIVVGDTVTGICINMSNAAAKCMAAMTMVEPIPVNHTSISGTLSTSNITMSNWSRMMWQSVVDRAIRMLASGPFGSHFFSARATVGES